MIGLTRKQRAALDFIRAFCLEHGAAPSFAEIADGLRLKSKSSVHRIVRALEARGHVERRRGQARSLAPVQLNALTLELPADIAHAVRVLARRGGTTAEAVIVEAVRDALADALRSPFASRETPVAPGTMHHDVRLARRRGVPFDAVCLELNPDKRPAARAQGECATTPAWSPLELIRMDRAFCDAMRREIARGTEQARGSAAKPGGEARAIRRFPAAPSRSGCSSAGEL